MKLPVEIILMIIDDMFTIDYDTMMNFIDAFMDTPYYMVIARFILRKRFRIDEITD